MSSLVRELSLNKSLTMVLYKWRINNNFLFRVLFIWENPTRVCALSVCHRVRAQKQREILFAYRWILRIGRAQSECSEPVILYFFFSLIHSKMFPGKKKQTEHNLITNILSPFASTLVTPLPYYMTNEKIIKMSIVYTKLILSVSSVHVFTNYILKENFNL